MGYIKINQDKVNEKIVKELKDICPFQAFDYNDEYLSINAACKVCKLCIKKGPVGVCEFIEDSKKEIDKSLFKGITVFIETKNGKAHPVSWELVAKAKELAVTSKEPVYALLVGYQTKDIEQVALSHGVDKVFVYDDKAFANFDVMNYTNVVEDFYKKYQVNVILFGGTSLGRSFAPRVAARLKTGLTADCTMLEMKENGDLMQIRPAFGGNIMAKIHTPNHRPQLATIRYKMFDANEVTSVCGETVLEKLSTDRITNQIKVIETIDKPTVKDISEASIIVAVGRAFKKKSDLELIRPLVEALGAEIACTRPLIENGWFDPRKQIGLSGRTVKPKLIINLGISGAVQYIEGMKDSELIISVNTTSDCKLMEISDYAIVGDVYEVIPALTKLVKNNDIPTV
jgi:electron transfer flavoprotein alpha subunit